MKLSSKTQYGMRILLQVAISTQKGKLAQGKEIASEQSINEPYLEQIMVSLKRAGVIQAVRGRNGGYLFSRDPKSITLLDIIELFEGPLSLAEFTNEKIPDGASDSISAIMEEISQTLRDEVASVTLADIIDAHRRKVPNYVI